MGSRGESEAAEANDNGPEMERGVEEGEAVIVWSSKEGKEAASGRGGPARRRRVIPALTQTVTPVRPGGIAAGRDAGVLVVGVPV